MLESSKYASYFPQSYDIFVWSPGLISHSPVPPKIIACFADWTSQTPVFPAKMPFQHSATTMLEEETDQGTCHKYS